jgi:hypothetical protein
VFSSSAVNLTLAKVSHARWKQGTYCSAPQTGRLFLLGFRN